MDHHTDVNAQRATDGVISLWIASQEGHIEARRSTDNFTPLCAAIQGGKIEASISKSLSDAWAESSSVNEIESTTP